MRLQALLAPLGNSGGPRTILGTAAVLALALASAEALTVYDQIPLAQMSLTQSGVSVTQAAQPTLAAYDTVKLKPPPIPNPAPQVAFGVPLERNAQNVPELSIQHKGPSFWGFSIEMSVITQVLGKNSSFIQVPFLNLMANLVERSGGVYIRLGGNTQEFAALVDTLPNGHTFGKEASGSSQTTKTPAVLYTLDMFYMAANISSLVNVRWFLGIPFNDSVNWRLDIAEKGEAILGSNLLGLQAGNEPDFYGQFGRRPIPYNPPDYNNDLQSLIKTIDANPNIPVKNNLIGPNIATGDWKPEDVWGTNFIDLFKDRLFCLSVEHYPANNCAAQFNTGNPIIDPQAAFPGYLAHDKVTSLVEIYYNSGMVAQAANLPLIMFETNTASCGGFAGISDSFGAALWTIDYGMQMAWSNFTHALLHIGGQNVFYNPFTAPPTNQSTFNEWTIGSTYYSTIVLAEAFGKSNTSQIVDLKLNNGNPYTPGYAIYEQGTLSKVALINYLDDLTGTNNEGGMGTSALQVSVSIPTGGVPGSVRVKYLTANSVSDHSDTMRWAGQTLGSMFQVDGRFKGDLNVTTIQCNTGANSCTIPVPSPGFALVFFGDDPSLSIGQATQTFPTTAHTKTRNTIVGPDPAVMATSNGQSAKDRKMGSTSPGSIRNGDKRLRAMGGFAAIAAVITGFFWVLW